MRSILLGIILTISLIFTSCLKDEDYVQFYVEIGNLVGDSISSYKIETDSYNILTPQNFINSSGFKFEDNARVIVQYSVINSNHETKEYDVKVNAIENLFEKNVVFIEEDGIDTLKKDPIVMTGAWIGKNYLNIEYNFRSSGRIDKPHYFDLAYVASKQNVENHIALDLIHNAQDDSYGPYYTRVIMTVALDDLKVSEQDSINIWLRVNDELYDANTITYKYNNIDK